MLKFQVVGFVASKVFIDANALLAWCLVHNLPNDASARARKFSFSTTRIAAFCADLARREPELPVYVGMAGPTDLAALMRYAQRCGVSASLRAMRNLGAGMVGLASHTDPHEQLMALAHYADTRRSCNVVGIHLYSFGGALRTGAWLADRLHRV